MNLRDEILRVIMSNVYARKEYAEDLADKIINLIDMDKQGKTEKQIKDALMFVAIALFFMFAGVVAILAIE